ncbi:MULTISPECIES: hypothetical protein [unclassified Streptomyces]|uniref:hypothetical protein n=1 Tax=unclassified Streptomyces TaxID=2593676 RepID=UPI0029AC1E32|nr:hypothetical protein [Streptomyces sp. DK15]MDX2396342.1 hypothetical protein [Streptomyces sp. DK15]
MKNLVRSTKSVAAALVTAPFGRLAAQAALALTLVSAGGAAHAVAQDTAVLAGVRVVADDPWSSAPLTKSDDPWSAAPLKKSDDPWSAAPATVNDDPWS